MNIFEKELSRQKEEKYEHVTFVMGLEEFEPVSPGDLYTLIDSEGEIRIRVLFPGIGPNKGMWWVENLDTVASDEDIESMWECIKNNIEYEQQQQT